MRAASGYLHVDDCHVALGSFVTYKAGIPNVGFVLNQGTNMYTADGVGSACLFLSFASNAAATAVIGYKAWYEPHLAFVRNVGYACSCHQ